VQRTIPFARIALDRDPDAINLWIGNSRSVTALHKDNYENIYVQVAGQKHFVLLPPVCQPCVNEQMLRPARYERSSSPSSGNGTNANTDGRLELVAEDEKAERVPFAIWDPDLPRENQTRYSKLAEPMRVTLNPGDMLYLPCMWCVPHICGSAGGSIVLGWKGNGLVVADCHPNSHRYHKVSQSCSPEGVCIAVNYW
jgi:jumonji domain-containing protein 7